MFRGWYEYVDRNKYSNILQVKISRNCKPCIQSHMMTFNLDLLILEIYIMKKKFIILGFLQFWYFIFFIIINFWKSSIWKFFGISKFWNFSILWFLKIWILEIPNFDIFEIYEFWKFQILIFFNFSIFHFFHFKKNFLNSKKTKLLYGIRKRQIKVLL